MPLLLKQTRCFYQKAPLWTYHSNNLSSHKVERVCELIETQGASVLPIRRTWTPSKRPGSNSNNCCAQPRHDPKKPSTRPSPNCSHASLLKTLRRGSDSALELYSN